jgi:hypothetical protein
MSKLKDWLFAYPPEVREPLIQQHTGTSTAYLYKKIYVTPEDEMPTFKARIAIGLDKASRGAVDFRTMLEGGGEIDWVWVRRRLNQMAKEGRLTEKEKVE